MEPVRAMEIVVAGGLAVVNLAAGPVYLGDVTEAQRAEILGAHARNDSIRFAKKYVKVITALEELGVMTDALPMPPRADATAAKIRRVQEDSQA